MQPRESLIYLVSAILTGLAVFGKAPLIADIVPVGGGVVYAACALSCLAPLLYRQFRKVARLLAIPIVVTVWLVALVVQSRLLEHLHSQGRGTDQGDCITVGITQLLHGSWPFDRDLMWSHNPMSCGPGWLVTHVPAAVIGYPATMAALFTGAVLPVYLKRGREAAANFVVLLALTPGFWLSYANGNDFVTFGVIVVAVSVLTNRWLSGLGALVLSQFRLPFVLLPAVLRTRRWKPLAALTSAVSVVIYVGFLWWSPGLMMTDGPLHVLDKSTNLLGLPGGRVTATVVFVVATVVVTAIALRFSARYSALVYLILTLAPLAVASLATTIHEQHGVIDILGHWEGVSWLTAIAAVSAGLVAMPERRTQRSTLSPNADRNAARSGSE